MSHIQAIWIRCTSANVRITAFAVAAIAAQCCGIFPTVVHLATGSHDTIIAQLLYNSYNFIVKSTALERPQNAPATPAFFQYLGRSP